MKNSAVAMLKDALSRRKPTKSKSTTTEDENPPQKAKHFALSWTLRYPENLKDLKRIKYSHQSFLKVLRIEGDVGSKASKFGEIRCARIIAHVIRRCKELVGLDLHRIFSLEGPAAAEIISKALKNGSSLKRLHSTWNWIGSEGAKALASAIQSPASTLEILFLLHNNVRDDGCVEIANALHQNQSIQTLCLCANNIFPKGAKAIATAISLKTSSLIELNLNGNRIGNFGCCAIANALLTNQSLRKLLLASNGIFQEGANELANALHHNSTLLELSLECNNIKRGGCASITNLLLTPNHSQLKMLDLSGNHVGEIGAQQMARVIATNTCLETLYFGAVQLNDCGYIEIIKSLRFNSSLKRLVLDSRCLGGEDRRFAREKRELWMALNASLDENYALQELIVRDASSSYINNFRVVERQYNIKCNRNPIVAQAVKKGTLPCHFLIHEMPLSCFAEAVGTLNKYNNLTVLFLLMLAQPNVFQN